MSSRVLRSTRRLVRGALLNRDLNEAPTPHVNACVGASFRSRVCGASRREGRAMLRSTRDDIENGPPRPCTSAPRGSYKRRSNGVGHMPVVDTETGTRVDEI